MVFVLRTNSFSKRVAALVSFVDMCETRRVELIIGKGVCPLEHPESVTVDYVEQTWIVTLAAFLQRCCGSIVTNTKRVVEPQRENDVYLMTFTEDMSKNKGR